MSDQAGPPEHAAPSLPPLPEAIGSLLFAAAGFVLFLLVLVETASFSPEAQPFPRLVSIAGMLGAAFAFAQSCQAALRAAGGASVPASVPTRHDLLISYLGPPAYGAMLLALGFWLASAMFLAGLLILLGERRPLIIISITGTTLGAIYLVFETGFGIHLPGSLLLQMVVS